MKSNLQRILSRSRIAMKIHDVHVANAKSSDTNNFICRVTFVREDEKRLSIVACVWAESESLDELDVMKALVTDVQAAEETEWGFAQRYYEGHLKSRVTLLLKQCRRLAKRLPAFFGEKCWNSIVGLTLE